MTSSFDEDLNRALSGAETGPQPEEKPGDQEQAASLRGTNRRVALAGALGLGTGIATTLAGQYAVKTMNSNKTI